MKSLLGITLLLLVAVTYAAPRSPAIIQVSQPDQVTEEEEEESPIVVDYWPRDDFLGFGEEEEYDEGEDEDDDFSPLQGSVDFSFSVNDKTKPVLANDTITRMIFKDLEERLAEDGRRMEKDFLLFRRLFSHSHHSRHWPSLFRPRVIPDDSPVFTHANPVYTGSSLPTPFYPSQPDDDGLLGQIPFFGMNRPLFPDIPEVPGVGLADPNELPDNYSNKTHEVHSINGTKVVVNNTINKESGDNFNSFFHHQVIHFRPEEGAQVPEDGSEVVPEEPVYEEPEDEGSVDDFDQTNTLPSVDNEVNSGGFQPETIPEVKAEFSSDTDTELRRSRPKEAFEDKEEFGSSYELFHASKKRIASRSMRKFNPIVFPADDPHLSIPDFESAALVSNRLTGDEGNDHVRQGDNISTLKSSAYSLTGDDAESVGQESSAYRLTDENEVEEIEEERRAPPDLSSDTRVNRVHANKQGMTRVDPDAEIFNYGLVLKEAQPREGDDLD